MKHVSEAQQGDKLMMVSASDNAVIREFIVLEIEKSQRDLNMLLYHCGMETMQWWKIEDHRGLKWVIYTDDDTNLIKDAK